MARSRRPLAGRAGTGACVIVERLQGSGQARQPGRSRPVWALAIPALYWFGARLARCPGARRRLRCTAPVPRRSAALARRSRGGRTRTADHAFDWKARDDLALGVTIFPTGGRWHVVSDERGGAEFNYRARAWRGAVSAGWSPWRRLRLSAQAGIEFKRHYDFEDDTGAPIGRDAGSAAYYRLEVSFGFSSTHAAAACLALDRFGAQRSPLESWLPMADLVSARHAPAWPAWPLPLMAGVLPLLATLIAYTLSVRLGLIEACNPFIDGCISISRAARHALPNHLFRALLLPAAVLQALCWLLCAAWLRTLGAAPTASSSVAVARPGRGAVPRAVRHLSRHRGRGVPLDAPLWRHALLRRHLHRDADRQRRLASVERGLAASARALLLLASPCRCWAWSMRSRRCSVSPQTRASCRTAPNGGVG